MSYQNLILGNKDNKPAQDLNIDTLTCNTLAAQISLFQDIGLNTIESFNTGNVEIIDPLKIDEYIQLNAITDPGISGLTGNDGRLYIEIASGDLNINQISGSINLKDPYSNDLYVAGTPTFNGASLTSDLDMNIHQITNLDRLSYDDMENLYIGFSSTQSLTALTYKQIDNMVLDQGGNLDGLDALTGVFTIPFDNMWSVELFLASLGGGAPTYFDLQVKADGNVIWATETPINNAYVNSACYTFMIPKVLPPGTSELTLEIQADDVCNVLVQGRFTRAF